MKIFVQEVIPYHLYIRRKRRKSLTVFQIQMFSYKKNVFSSTLKPNYLNLILITIHRDIELVYWHKNC